MGQKWGLGEFPWMDDPAPVDFQPSPLMVQVITGMKDELGQPIVPLAFYTPIGRQAYVLNKDTGLSMAHNMVQTLTGIVLATPGSPLTVRQNGA